MTPFLKAIALYIKQQYQTQTDSLVIVMPNQRSGHFLKKYISETFPDAVWSPDIFDLNNWIVKQVDLRICDPTDLLFLLYSCYRKIEPQGSSFEEFYPWGEIVLSDFDEIDKNLINPIQLFRNIIDYQQIQSDYSYLSEKQIQSIQRFFENFKTGGTDGIKQKSSQIWQILPDLYEKFTESLQARGQCYEGLAYKIFSSQAINGIAKDKQYLFVGFNALTESELTIFKRFKSTGQAQYFFDYDQYYLKDEQHEAGRFLRENLRNFPMPEAFLHLSGELELFTSLAEKPKMLTAYTLSSDHGQASLLAEILTKSTHSLSGQADELAIVLPDESILPAIISSFPEQFRELNISLGYPLKSTQAAGLSELLFQLHRSRTEDGSGQVAWHRNALSELLRHDYLQAKDNPKLSSFIQKLSRSNRNYHRITESNEFIQLITRKIEEGKDFLQLLIDCFTFLIENPINELPSIEKEFIYQYLLAVSKFQHQLNDFPETLSMESCFKILNRSIRKNKIAFKGEPLRGIQLIGPLETRLLDFKHLIILSLNDGVFPPIAYTPSFIPYSIKQGFGMQTRDMKDAIYSYYFYRLLQRCSTVDFFIPSTSSGGNKSEPSRFIHQLNYSKSFQLHSKIAGNRLSIGEKSNIQINKGEELLSQLKYLSPTSLNYYLDCSLKFYFRYILKIKTDAEGSENIGLAEFGNLIHHFMEKLYEGRGMIQPEFLKGLLQEENQLRTRLYQAFSHFGYAEGEEIPVSENRLIFDNLITYLKALLGADLAYAPFEILGTEKEISMSFNISGQSIEIKGTIDRIDRKGRIVRIMDYKTGKDDLSVKALDKLFDRSIDDRQKAIFQLLIYSIAYEKELKNFEQIEAHIFNLKKIFQREFDSQILINNEKVNLQTTKIDFIPKLQNLFEELFDLSIPFSQTEYSKRCTNCDFNLICKR
jgi:CRISPR/Cas system-associated exonuclease Cas4 (RecB family)